MELTKFFSINRLKAIIKKEFIQIKRDPISVRIPIIMPIMMMLLFGYAVNTEVDNISTVVFDQSKTLESREYLEKFVVSDYFRIDYTAISEQEINDLIDSGKVKAAIIIPPDFSEKLRSKQVPQTQLIIDGTDPTTARTALNSGIIISEMYSKTLKEIEIKRIGIVAPKLPSVSLRTKVWYNPNLKSSRFTIPGLVGIILQNVTIMLTAFAIVRERERGTIEQLMVSPIRPVELIIGKLIPYIFIGYSGFLFALFLSVYWFGVAVEGSLLLLLSLGFLFVICSLSIGLLISTFAKNQLQAMMGLIIVLLPTILLSGFVFPRESMPFAIRIIGNLLPLTYFLEITRGIVLKGVGINLLQQNILSLTAFTVVLLSLAILRFRKSLD